MHNTAAVPEAQAAFPAWLQRPAVIQALSSEVQTAELQQAPVQSSEARMASVRVLAQAAVLPVQVVSLFRQ